MLFILMMMNTITLSEDRVRERPKGITLKDLPKVHQLRDGPFSPPEEVLLPSLMVVGPSDVPRSQEIWAMR